MPCCKSSESSCQCKTARNVLEEVYRKLRQLPELDAKKSNWIQALTNDAVVSDCLDILDNYFNGQPTGRPTSPVDGA